VHDPGVLADPRWSCASGIQGKERARLEFGGGSDLDKTSLDSILEGSNL
jgi:hypothetical protein